MFGSRKQQRSPESPKVEDEDEDEDVQSRPRKREPQRQQLNAADQIKAEISSLKAVILSGSKKLASGSNPIQEIGWRLEILELAVNTLIEESAQTNAALREIKEGQDLTIRMFNELLDS